ncbi:hypothetical protein U1Q18_016094 [Sarracenia purpurea var. burkii]
MHGHRQSWIKSSTSLDSSVRTNHRLNTTSGQRKPPTAAGNLLLPKLRHALAVEILFAGFSQKSIPFNFASCNAKHALINLLWEQKSQSHHRQHPNRQLWSRRRRSSVRQVRQLGSR